MWTRVATTYFFSNVADLYHFSVVVYVSYQWAEHSSFIEDHRDDSKIKHSCLKSSACICHHLLKVYVDEHRFRLLNFS